MYSLRKLYITSNSVEYIPLVNELRIFHFLYNGNLTRLWKNFAHIKRKTTTEIIAIVGYNGSDLNLKEDRKTKQSEWHKFNFFHIISLIFPHPEI